MKIYQINIHNLNIINEQFYFLNDAGLFQNMT